MATMKQLGLSLVFGLVSIVQAAPQVDDFLHPVAVQHLGQRNGASPPPLTFSVGDEHTVRTCDYQLAPRNDAGPSAQTTFTYITPSAGALPIPVTTQNQVVTSYLPVSTICPTSTAPSAPLPSASVFLTPSANPAAANATANGTSCSTSYTPTVTTACHTTLSPLAAPLIPITACGQSVTFSSEYGYTLVPATITGIQKRQELPPTSGSSTVETLTTFYVAAWSELSVGVVPTRVATVVSSSREAASVNPPPVASADAAPTASANAAAITDAGAAAAPNASAAVIPSASAAAIANPVASEPISSASPATITSPLTSGAIGTEGTITITRTIQSTSFTTVTVRGTGASWNGTSGRV